MDFLTRLLDSSSTLLALRVGPEGRVADVNPALTRAMGIGREALVGLSARGLFHEEHRPKLDDWLGGEMAPREPVDLLLRTATGDTLPLRVLVQQEPDGLRLVGERRPPPPDEATEELTRMNNELAALARERAREQRYVERTERRTRDALDDLRSSYWHLKKIQEVLPLCMGCGRVKGEKGSWQSFVDYLKENEILVSHAYCPSCEERYMESPTDESPTRSRSGTSGEGEGGET